MFLFNKKNKKNKKIKKTKNQYNELKDIKIIPEKEVKIEKKEIIVELFVKSSLPKHGWIQCCQNCEVRTSQQFEFKKIETKDSIYIINVYLCKSCNRENIINNEKFIIYLNKIIRRKYYLPVEPNPPYPL